MEKLSGSICLLKDRGKFHHTSVSVWKSELKFSSSAPNFSANETSCLMSLEDKGSARGDVQGYAFGENTGVYFTN